MPNPKSRHRGSSMLAYIGLRTVRQQCPVSMLLIRSRSARQALNLLLIPSQSDDDSVQPAIEFFDQLEIYPGMFPM